MLSWCLSSRPGAKRRRRGIAGTRSWEAGLDVFPGVWMLSKVDAVRNVAGSWGVKVGMGHGRSLVTREKAFLTWSFRGEMREGGGGMCAAYVLGGIHTYDGLRWGL